MQEAISFLQRNDTSQARLRDLIAQFDEEGLGRGLGDGWTVSASLAHLAFWDRRTLQALQEWRCNGMRTPPTDSDAINERERSTWLAMPPEAAASDAVGSAELVDREIASLPEALAEAILASGRVRPLDRSRHRDEHLDEIDRALRS